MIIIMIINIKKSLEVVVKTTATAEYVCQPLVKDEEGTNLLENRNCE